VTGTLEIPDYADVLIVTHLLELPRDLGLPNDTGLAVTEERDDCFQGWSDEGKAQLIGLPEIPTPNTSPVARFIFRRIWGPERAPLMAAYQAFDSWIAPNMPTEAIDELRAMHEQYLTNGSFGWITVVAASSFVPAQNWPTDESERASAQGAELDKCLSRLNVFLLALGLARNDPSVAPVARGDLPFVCPVILETAPMPDGVRNAVSFPYQIHHINPHKHRRDPDRTVDDLDDAERLALDVFRAAYFSDEPWFLFYELMQQALGGHDEHRDRAPVVALGSAVEVLFAATIRRAALLRGEPEAAVAAILEYPLRNQVEHHLPRFVNCRVDLDDPDNPFGRWWQGGYKLRNRVVHDGYRPERNEIRAALDDAMALVEALGNSLGSDPVTAPLANWVGKAKNYGNVETEALD
jgi:hypothetical protein